MRYPGSNGPNNSLMVENIRLLNIQSNYFSIKILNILVLNDENYGSGKRFFGSFISVNRFTQRDPYGLNTNAIWH